jgi:hypothetical protein
MSDGMVEEEDANLETSPAKDLIKTHRSIDTDDANKIELDLVDN